MGQLFGPIRGGLGYCVIIVGFILGTITGTYLGAWGPSLLQIALFAGSAFALSVKSAGGVDGHLVLWLNPSPEQH